MRSLRGELLDVVVVDIFLVRVVVEVSFWASLGRRMGEVVSM
jgi:hypothetical protein